MIQQADAGIGIEGKEGKQASLAGDFSILQFSHLARLLLVHGRRSYKRSASLSQFVVHRGLIISVMQAVFSSVFYLSSVPLYQGFLMVGYATVYTMFPVSRNRFYSFAVCLNIYRRRLISNVYFSCFFQ